MRDPTGQRRAFITGATGFVGRRFALALGAENRPLRLLVRQPDRLDPALRDAVNVEIVPGDLRDGDLLARAVAGCGTVFNCAAWLPGGEPGAAEAVNVRGVRGLGAAARTAGARVVHLSSTAALGSPQADIVDETTKPLPYSPYEVTKLEGERALLAIEGLNPVILRPPMVTGEGVRGGPLLKLFKLCRRGAFPAFGGRLDVEKPLIAVEDLLLAMLAAEAVEAASGPYFVHSNGEHTLKRILKTVGRLVGRERPWVVLPAAVARLGAALSAPVFKGLGREPPLTATRLDLFLADRRIDTGKAARDLAFAPQIRDLDAMLRPTYAWFVASGQLRAASSSPRA